jgi:hypothetical protein
LFLTNEERRTTLVAAVGGAAVLLIYFVVLPLWNRWTELGAALEPKLSLLDKLEERARAQNALLARREALERELGQVTGGAGASNPAPGAPSSGAPAAAPSSSAPTSVVPSPASGKTHRTPSASANSTAPRGAPPAAAAMPGPAATPAATIAAYVERQARILNIRFNSVTPCTPMLGYRNGKFLMPAGIVVTLETATPAFLRLLYALEKGDRLMRVERMEIHRDLKKGQIITATLQIVGYEAAAP